MRKRKKHCYIEKKYRTIAEKILESVRLHDRLIGNWQSDIGSRISYEFSFNEEIGQEPDNIFKPLEEKFLSVKSVTLREGLLLGLWDGAYSVCWSHEGNAACTDEAKNAEDKRIYDSSKKYCDKYDKMLLDILSQGRGFEYNGDSFRLRAHQGDKYDEYMIVIGVDYTVNGESFTAECAVSDETIEAVCYWENFLLEEQEEFCYNFIDYYDDDHKFLSFNAEKTDDGINVTVTLFDEKGIHEFKNCMSRNRYYEFVNFFTIIRIVLLDSRRCWL